MILESVLQISRRAKDGEKIKRIQSFEQINEDEKIAPPPYFGKEFASSPKEGSIFSSSLSSSQAPQSIQLTKLEEAEHTPVKANGANSTDEREVGDASDLNVAQQITFSHSPFKGSHGT